MHKRLTVVPFLLVIALCCPPVFAANMHAVESSAVQPLVIGDTFTIQSQALGETRRINVYLPPGYAATATLRVPALYMPDGGMAEDFLHVAGLVAGLVGNGTMRPFLLVGIENTERRRDLTGPTGVAADRKIAPPVGGSAAFRSFIRDELMPAIARRYRTTRETAIVGESLAGLFVVETFFARAGPVRHLYRDRPEPLVEPRKPGQDRGRAPARACEAAHVPLSREQRRERHHRAVAALRARAAKRRANGPALALREDARGTALDDLSSGCTARVPRAVRAAAEELMRRTRHAHCRARGHGPQHADWQSRPAGRESAFRRRDGAPTGMLR